MSSTICIGVENNNASIQWRATTVDQQQQLQLRQDSLYTAHIMPQSDITWESGILQDLLTSPSAPFIHQWMVLACFGTSPLASHPGPPPSIGESLPENEPWPEPSHEVDTISKQPWTKKTRSGDRREGVCGPSMVQPDVAITHDDSWLQSDADETTENATKCNAASSFPRPYKHGIHM